MIKAFSSRVFFNIGGPVAGVIANTARLIDNRKPVEENNNNGVESSASSNVNDPWQAQDQSIGYPWQNSGTGSSVTDQSTPATTGQTTNTKFAINSKVETTNSLNVRSGPGLSYGTVGETKTAGSTGTILSGPVYADGLPGGRYSMMMVPKVVRR